MRSTAKDMSRNWRSRLCALVAFLAISCSDAMIAEGVFREGNAWQYIDPYLQAMFLVLVPSVAVVGFALSLDRRFPAYLLALIYGGAEDIAYYLVQLRAPPPSFPWLPGSPTLTELSVKAVSSTALVAVADATDSKLRLWDKFITKAKEVLSRG